MNTFRVALVYRPPFALGEEERVGSGYLVTDDLVMTALHVVRGTDRGYPLQLDCEVKLLDEYGVGYWRSAQMVWPTAAEWADHARLDVAVLKLKAPVSATPGSMYSEPPLWCAAMGDSIACKAAGFPEGSVFDRNNRDVRLMTGQTDAITGHVQGLLFVGLASQDAVAPAMRFDKAESWAGFSGAALFDGTRLIGVMIVAERGSRTLQARRVETFMRVPGFRVLVGLPEEEGTPKQLPPSRDRPSASQRSPLDVVKPFWTADEKVNLAGALLRCGSFRDGKTRASLVSRALAPRHPQMDVSSRDADAEEIVSACLDADGSLGRLLRGMREYEEGSAPWVALLWLLADLRDAVPNVSLLKRLAKVAEALGLSNSERDATFARAASRFEDASFEKPASWQDAIAVLADHAVDGVPGPMLLAYELDQATLRKNALLKAWIADVERGAGVQPKPRRRVLAPRPRSSSVTLTFEVSRGPVRPDRGFQAFSYLSLGGESENWGSLECDSERELKAWVADRIAGLARHPGSVALERKPRIEFLLPDDLLSLEVDLWPLNPSEVDPLPIGLLYPVVIRSRWRARDPSAAILAGDWRNWWKRLRRDGCLQMHWLESPASNQPDALFSILSMARHGSVGFGFPSRGKNALAHFGRALRAGAPVIVWTRQDSTMLAQAENDLRSWVEGKLSDLPDRLLKRRLEARQVGQSDLGFHVSLLCDDPEKIPPQVAPLTNKHLG